MLPQIRGQSQARRGKYSSENIHSGSIHSPVIFRIKNHGQVRVGVRAAAPGFNSAWEAVVHVRNTPKIFLPTSISIIPIYHWQAYEFLKCESQSKRIVITV